MKAHRGRLRPYTQPPYKHKKSHYELHMRTLREQIRRQALKIANTLKIIEPDDPVLPEMLQDLQIKAHVDQLSWIDAATDEMHEIAASLEPGTITIKRIDRLVGIRDKMFDALEQHKHANRADNTLSPVPSYEVSVEGAKVHNYDDFRRANLVKDCMVELIESLALPFWPRVKPVDTRSGYAQGVYKPKINKVRQRMRDDEKVAKKKEADKRAADAQRARDHTKVREQRRAEGKKANEEDEKNQIKEQAKKKEPKTLFVCMAGNFRPRNLKKLKEQREKAGLPSSRKRPPLEPPKLKNTLCILKDRDKSFPKQPSEKTPSLKPPSSKPRSKKSPSPKPSLLEPGRSGRTSAEDARSIVNEIINVDLPAESEPEVKRPAAAAPPPPLPPLLPATVESIPEPLLDPGRSGSTSAEDARSIVNEIINVDLPPESEPELKRSAAPPPLPVMVESIPEPLLDPGRSGRTSAEDARRIVNEVMNVDLPPESKPEFERPASAPPASVPLPHAATAAASPPSAIVESTPEPLLEPGRSGRTSAEDAMSIVDEVIDVDLVSEPEPDSDSESLDSPLSHTSHVGPIPPPPSPPDPVIREPPSPEPVIISEPPPPLPPQPEEPKPEPVQKSPPPPPSPTPPPPVRLPPLPEVKPAPPAPESEPPPEMFAMPELGLARSSTAEDKGCCKKKKQKNSTGYK